MEYSFLCGAGYLSMVYSLPLWSRGQVYLVSIEIIMFLLDLRVGWECLLSTFTLEFFLSNTNKPI